MRVALLGFMAAGKSTVGPLLAEKLAVPFLDTDELIEQKAGESIPRIFSHYGEEYFRALEKEVLVAVIAGSTDFVLATGGGIVLSAENRSLLLEKTFPVLLTATPEVIYNRIKGEGGRPLLEVENPRTKIAELLKSRNKYYNDFPHAISTGQKSPQKICLEIISLLREESGGEMENIIKSKGKL
ncbi:MAG: shikimate kinase [Halanaerobiaceae bacterium]